MNIPKHDKDPGTPELRAMCYSKGAVDHKALCKAHREKNQNDHENPKEVPLSENNIPPVGTQKKPAKRSKKSKEPRFWIN